MLKEFKNKIALGVVAVIGTRVIALFTGIATLPLFYHHLPKDVLGIWMLLLGADIFVNLSDLGFSPVLSRHIAFELGKGDREEISNYRGSSFYYSLARWTSLYSSLILFIVISLLGILFLSSLNLHPALFHAAVVSLVIFSLSKAILVRFKFYEVALQGHGEVGWKEWIYSGSVLLSLAGYYAVFTVLHGSIIELTVVMLLQSVVIAIATRIVVQFRIQRNFRSSVKVGWADINPLIRPALDMFLVSIGSFLIFNTDQYFIVKFLGPEALPDYAAAFRIAMMILVFTTTASSFIVPFVSRLSASEDRKSLHRLLLINTSVVMITHISGMLLYAFLGDRLTTLWLGPGHFIGWKIVWVLGTTMTLECHHVIFAQIGLNAKNDPTWGKMSILSGLINLVLTFFGIRVFGLLGVALGTMIAQMLTNNWYAVLKTLRIIRLNAGEYFMKSGIIWCSYAICAAALLWTVRSSPLSNVPLLVASLSVCCVLYIMTLWVYARQLMVGTLKL